MLWEVEEDEDEDADGKTVSSFVLDGIKPISTRTEW